MYAMPRKQDSGNQFDFLFIIVLIMVVSGLFGTAWTLRHVKLDISRNEGTYNQAIKTQFIMKEREIAPNVQNKEIVVRKTVLEKKVPVDLSEKPVMAEKSDEIQDKKALEEKPVRRVYGLKKVYSRGIGVSGSLSDAVIGKLGNTIHTEIDTFSATEQECKGVVVSTTTVTQAPRFKKTVKPEYTKEMIEQKLEGVVKLKVLVDIDGKVKKAIVVTDIGLNSAEKALEATKKMEFIPAMRGDETVAVWIIIPIRFVMIS